MKSLNGTLIGAPHRESKIRIAEMNEERKKKKLVVTLCRRRGRRGRSRRRCSLSWTASRFYEFQFIANMINHSILHYTRQVKLLNWLLRIICTTHLPSRRKHAFLLRGTTIVKCKWQPIGVVPTATDGHWDWITFFEIETNITITHVRRT